MFAHPQPLFASKTFPPMGRRLRTGAWDVVGGANAHYFVEIAVEGRNGVEAAALRHVSHCKTRSLWFCVDDAARLLNAILVDEVVECFSALIQIGGEIGLVAAHCQGKVSERQVRIEINLLFLHAKLQ